MNKTNRIRRVVFHLWICLSAAYVALLPQFYLVYDPGNRYMMLWSRSYHLSILSAIASLALSFYLARVVLGYMGRRWGGREWFERAILLWLIFLSLRTISALLVHLTGLPPPVRNLLWNPWFKFVIYVVLPSPFLLFFAGPARRALRGLYLSLSILLAFFLFSSATWPTFEKYDATINGTALAQKTSTGQNFLVFFMDEWDYGRSFGNPDWHTNLPALSALLEESTLYTQAYSLGGETRLSLPRFMFSTDEEFMAKTYPEVFDFNESGRPYSGSSIFDVVPNTWLRVAIGFAINYPVILSGKTDLAIRFESENVRRDFSGEFQRLLLSQIAFLRILGVHHEPVESPDWFPQLEIHHYAMDLLRLHHVNTLGIFHYCWPHYPYLWNRDGRKQESIEPRAAQAHTVQNYMDNLKYLDVVIGEICTALKDTGKWDESVVVFTSDHAWRWDPENPRKWSDDSDEYLAEKIRADADALDEFRHVPLIIKYPHQQSGKVESSTVVSHGKIHRLLDEYLRTNHFSQSAERLKMD